jgi:hypothetical protein
MVEELLDDVVVVLDGVVVVEVVSSSPPQPAKGRARRAPAVSAATAWRRLTNAR